MLKFNIINQNVSQKRVQRQGFRKSKDNNWLASDPKSWNNNIKNRIISFCIKLAQKKEFSKL